jgi:hypothetical protein
MPNLAMNKSRQLNFQFYQSPEEEIETRPGRRDGKSVPANGEGKKRKSTTNSTNGKQFDDDEIIMDIELELGTPVL